MEEIRELLRKLIYKEILLCENCPLEGKCKVRTRHFTQKKIDKLRERFATGTLYNMQYSTTDKDELLPVTKCTLAMLSRVAQRCIAPAKEITID